jgi:hypothetical protein
MSGVSFDSLGPPQPGFEWVEFLPGTWTQRVKASEPVPVPNMTLILVKQLAERFAKLEAKLDAFMKAFE